MDETKLNGIGDEDNNLAGIVRERNDAPRKSSKASASPVVGHPTIWDIAYDEITATVWAELRF